MPSATITVTRDALPARSTPQPAATRSERIFLRGDRAVPYGDVMQLMNDLRDAGYLKIALVGMETREAK